MPFCADCNEERETDEHGKCNVCGSRSIAHLMHPLVLLQGAKKIIEGIGEPNTIIKKATLDFVSAQYAYKRGISLGQHLENAVSMYEMAKELDRGVLQIEEENGEKKDDADQSDKKYN